MHKCKLCKILFQPCRGARGVYCSSKCWARSPEKARINRHALKGKKLSKAHKLKMRMAKLGKKQPRELVEKRIASIRSNGNWKWKKSTILKRANANRGQKRTGKAYQNILDGIARSHGYKNYKSIPHEDNPDWRGPEWKKIREEIKKRDGYKCQKCPKTKRLQVHHIVPWRKTHDNSPSNLITLCINCHQREKGINKKPTR
jgi:hypothetical protein